MKINISSPFSLCSLNETDAHEARSQGGRRVAKCGKNQERSKSLSFAVKSTQKGGVGRVKGYLGEVRDAERDARGPYTQRGRSGSLDCVYTLTYLCRQARCWQVPGTLGKGSITAQMFLVTKPDVCGRAFRFLCSNRFLYPATFSGLFQLSTL
jgi:hypothetical protein